VRAPGEGIGGPSPTSPYRFLVALRLLRARKINLIGILGVMVGVASIIVVMAVMDGFQHELRAMIRGTLSDMIIELHPRGAARFGEIQAAVEAVPGVAACSLQKHSGAFVNAQIRDAVDGSRRNTIPLVVVGILPEDERRVSQFFRYVLPAEGQPEDPFEVEPIGAQLIQEETPRLVLSRGLAKRIGFALDGAPLVPGRSFPLVALSVSADDGRSSVATADYEVVVSRLYDSHNSEYDRLYVYTSLVGPGAKLFPENGEVIVELRIKLDDYRRARELAAPIARAVGPFDPQVLREADIRVQTWEERQANLLGAVNHEKMLLAIVLFFIVVVASFNIFSTLTMTVVEKTRDIGVLRAIGATPGGILSIFLFNGALVGALGAALGYGLGLYLADNVNTVRDFLRSRFGVDIFPSDIYSFDTIPTWIDHRAAILFGVGAVVFALLFAIIPAARAARLRPVSALRYE